jgi:hypothetical protein
VALAAYYLGLLINLRGLATAYQQWKAGKPDAAAA